MTALKIKKILIPIDFSYTSLKALDHAVTMAKLTKAEIILLHVMENQYASADPFFVANVGIISFEKKLTKISYESLNKLAAKITKKGIENVKVLSVNGRTHSEIIKMSNKYKVDIIIMGTHGVSGFREFVMGSNTFRVVSDALCPVLSVQRKSNAKGFKNILVPFCDRPHSREKVMHAIQMAELFQSKIYVLGIDEEKTTAHKKKIMLEANQIKGIVERHNLVCEIEVVSEAYDAKTVLGYANKINSDLIFVMGDIVKHDITEYFTGSFSQQLINHSAIPILSVHSKVNPKMIELWQGI